MAVAQDPAISILEAMVLGLVEGLTEFLPVSSTGHLILVGDLLAVQDIPTFEIAIQVGAISAILFLYRQRLGTALGKLFKPRGVGGPGEADGQVNLLVLLVVAAAPAALLGLFFQDGIERHLFNSRVVVSALILGGVLLIVLERWLRRGTRTGFQSRDIEAMGLGQAFAIGLFQCLALIPGTSRAGAMIAGGLILGFSRAAAAEFSFLVGLPILYGACLVKLLGDLEVLSGPMLPALVVATMVAFISAALIVKPFVNFLRGHTFVPFGIYRIVLGLGLGVFWLAGWMEGAG